MGLREVRKELQELDNEKLVFIISELYKKYPEAKTYLDFFTNPDEDKLLEDYKAKVHEGFYPKRGWRLKLKRSRTAINTFKKLGVSPESECALLLYFTEVAVMYAREKKPRTESYYTRLENSFEKALELIEKHALLKEFEEPCRNAVERSEKFPWNCHAHMVSLFNRYYHR